LKKDIGICDYCSTEPVYETSQDIDVPSKDGRAIHVDFYPGVEVTGIIHWAGAPSRYFDSYGRLCLASATASYCGRTTKPEDFHIPRVQPGAYNLIAGFAPGGFRASIGPGGRSAYVVETRWNGAPVLGSQIVIAPDARQATLDLTYSASFAHCVPRVVGRDRHPLSLYTVALMQRQKDHYLVEAVDPHNPNAYSFLPGQYLLLALTPALPLAAFRAEFLEQYADRALPVTLTAGETLKVEVVAIEDHPLARWLSALAAIKQVR
jgi:hypothetical protein